MLLFRVRAVPSAVAGGLLIIQLARPENPRFCRNDLVRERTHPVPQVVLTSLPSNRPSLSNTLMERDLNCTFVAFAPDESYDAPAVTGAAGQTNSREVRPMKFPGGLNIQQMMKQAQAMQEKMAKEMDELRVEASSGGGVVTVAMKGNHEIVALKIDPEAVKEGDVEMLQDLIVAAANEANRKIDEAMKSKIGGMLPPGLGGMLG